MVNKPEQHEQELAIHALRNDAGVVSVRAWLYGQRDRLNRTWPSLRDDDLLIAQGEARAWQRLINIIENQPTTKHLTPGA